MELEWLLYIIICILVILCFLQNIRILTLNENAKALKRKLKVKTNFEKLTYIVEIYRSIDFSKLRPDQLKLWNDWVTDNLK